MLNKFSSSVPWKDRNVRKTVWTINYSNLFILISEMKWKKIYLFLDKKVVFTPVQMLKLKHWFIHYQCEHYMFLYKSLCYLYTVEPCWYGHQWVKKNWPCELGDHNYYRGRVKFHDLRPLWQIHHTLAFTLLEWQLFSLMNNQNVETVKSTWNFPSEHRTLLKISH